MKKYKVREVIKLLEADGWVKLKGSGAVSYTHLTLPTT